MSFKISKTDIVNFSNAKTNLNVPRFGNLTAASNVINPTGDILFNENDGNYYGTVNNNFVLLGGQNADFSNSLFSHNFLDDISTDEIFLPWADTLEQTASNYRNGFLANNPMTLQRFSIRPENINDDFVLTVRFFCVDNGVDPGSLPGPGSRTNESNATISFNDSTDNHITKILTPNDFTPVLSTNTLTISPTQLGFLTIEASNDPGFNIDWYVSSTWNIDYNN